MYRHIYLTNFYKGKSMPSLIEMTQLSKEMGHSINTQLQSIKSDAPEE
jgi:hypothetical protein